MANAPAVKDGEGRPAAMWDQLTVVRGGGIALQEHPGGAEFLANVQAHVALDDPALVEAGQIVAIRDTLSRIMRDDRES